MFVPEGFNEDIESIVIGNSVTSIGNGAFYGCSSLKSVVIGNFVESIGAYAFQGCCYGNLTSITIPSSVTNIGDVAFNGWTSSQTINIQGRTSAPSGWDPNWTSICDAIINWNT